MNSRITRFLFGTTIGLMIALLLLVIPTPTPARAIGNLYSINVNTLTDEYSSVDDGACSLREAIRTANDKGNFGGCLRIISDFGGGPGPDTIWLPSGTYTLTIVGANEDLDATGDLDLRASMIISATGATAPTVTGGAGWDDRIFHILTGTVTIKSIVISGGSVSSDGGGAVLIKSGSLTLSDSTISGNSANNSISGLGGGIWNFSGNTTTLNNVTISGNSAAFGGGILNYGTLTLNNVTISGNLAANNGGGIFSAGVATLNNVTINGNAAPSAGGGIYVSTNTLVTPTMVILSGNSFANCNGSFTGSDANLSSDNTCGFGAGRSNVNVKLAPLGNYGGSTQTHMLLPGSPAIDNGDNLACPATDQRGKPRPIGAGCDVGAVERQLVDYVLLYLPLIFR
jgi:CSLREA domain-containing protein